MSSLVVKRFNEIIKKYRTSDPFEIADKIGIKLFYADLDCRGVYVPIDDVKVIILNEKYKNRPEAKFVMAHELFHALEHSDMMALYHDGYMVKPKKEREANQFATYICLVGQEFRADMTREQICRQCYIPLEMQNYI